MNDSVTAATLVTFGEAMLRLSPPGHERLARATSLDVYVGGTESSVACALPQLKLIPSGGIQVSNVAEFLGAGAVGGAPVSAGKSPEERPVRES